MALHHTAEPTYFCMMCREPTRDPEELCEFCRADIRGDIDRLIRHIGGDELEDRYTVASALGVVLEDVHTELWKERREKNDNLRRIKEGE